MKTVRVDQNDFGNLVESYIKIALRSNYIAAEPKLREWWPKIEDYYQRHIITNIEVAILLSDDEVNHYLNDKHLWQQFIKDFRPPRSKFTADYHCHKCKKNNIKLWRGVHGAPDENGYKLICANCLVPDLKVDDKGKIQGEFGYTDQINGWLPAIPVDDTYWGYSSVPSQDVEWWIALPTY